MKLGKELAKAERSKTRRIMKPRNNWIKVVVVITSLAIGQVSAVENGQLVDVVATGYGSTVREATKAALRTAVEQVVGTMIDATTLVENDKLIEDEILTYSAGMVESTKVIGEPKKSEDGIYSVKIKATVKKKLLEEKLKATSTVNVSLDGADLFARMTAAKDNLADAEAMLKALFDKNKYTGCLIAEAQSGKDGTQAIELDPITGELFVNIRVRIDQTKYTRFANEIVEKLDKMAFKKIKLHNLNSRSRQEKTRSIATVSFKKTSISGVERKGDDFADVYAYHYNYNSYHYVCSLLVVTNCKTGSAIVYQLDKNLQDAISPCFDTGSLTIAVTLYDVQGEEVVNRFVPLCPERLEHNNKAASIFAKGYNFFCVVPFYDASIFDPSTIKSGRSADSLRISLGKFKAEELKSVCDLKIKVGHMKGSQFTE